MTEADCLPLESLPGTTPLFRDFVLRKPQAMRFYATDGAEARHDPATLAGVMEEQNRGWGAGDATLKNIAALRNGARSVVTGQQVTLFGGPLYVLLKAATAIARARVATAAGIPTVPVFWMATEDHDFAEVAAASFPDGDEVRTLRLSDQPALPAPVGAFLPGDSLPPLVDELDALLATAANPEFARRVLREAYAPGRSMTEMFARLILRVFADQGLIVLDASVREVHRLGDFVLRKAVTDAATLHDALRTRTRDLTASGYHAQVLVNEESSLLFLVREDGARVALRRSAHGEWRAAGVTLTEDELLRIVENEPERLSPSALLRPVFQDCVLPTSAYIAGPAEIAYFAQTAVLYEAILEGGVPLVPRLSASLLTPKVLRVLKRDALSVTDAWRSAEELAVRLGARAMSADAKQKLAATGNALDSALRELTAQAEERDAALAHSATIAANKMRYQMNRLRRLMARYEEQREPAIQQRARLAVHSLYPGGHLQERVIAGLWFLAEAGESLPGMLVDAAADACPGHRVLAL